MCRLRCQVHKYLTCLITISPFLIVLLSNCTTIIKPGARRPLNEDTIQTVLEKIRDQQQRVTTFYTSGKLSAGTWYGESEADLLVVGTKNPLKVKVEVSHAWGPPILHLLIIQGKLRVLSFKDKKLYVGALAPETLSRFFAVNIEPELIWGVLRGYPELLDHEYAISRQSDQIVLVNKNREDVEWINLSPESLLPGLVSFPDKYFELTFSDFHESEGIYYAGEVKVTHRKEKKHLVLKNGKMVFNRKIPDEIFVLKKPPQFTTYDLDD